MKRWAQWIVALSTLIAVAIAAVKLGYLEVPSEHEIKIKDPPIAPTTKSVKQMEQLGLVTQRLNQIANVAPSKQEIDQDLQFFKQQVASIELRLPTHDVEQRISDTEQLAAYPVPEAAGLLAQILEADPDPTVREMAAQSLGALEPETESVDSLFRAFDDNSERVQSAALLALERLLQKDLRDMDRQLITRGLERKSREQRLPPRLRSELLEFLADQVVR